MCAIAGARERYLLMRAYPTVEAVSAQRCDTTK
jgi:hypothetical protein